MKGLYGSPLRVYFCLGLLALAGVLSGLQLPVSLFPNSSKPKVTVNIQYGNSTPDEFLQNYGRDLEEQLRAIRNGKIEVEKTTASYEQDRVWIEVGFRWGADSRLALKEVQSTVNTFSAVFPKEIRDSIGVWSRDESGGFLAISFFSPVRSLDEVYDLLEPVLIPKVTQVQDAQSPSLWNPSQKEIRIEIDPNRMAAFQLLPKAIDRAVNAALGASNGGAVTVGTQRLTVQMPRRVSAVEDLSLIPIQTPSGQAIHLSDVAHVDIGLKTSDTRSFKTSGAPSVLLFSEPRPGGNVKRMSEEIIEIVKEVLPTLPKDIQYRILVDPSEFIRASIDNVIHEVLLGAFLAVLVLYLFIGSLRNTITAAIEIPLSMVLAFIMMRLTGMNLNLISLGGLALSAGMNVDASVVVMENIFRKFEVGGPGGGIPKTFAERLRRVVESVVEVRFAVIASTIASLVVFLPLAFTSDLSYAILGDLAKTVVFSHGFSAIVALILVPTVRLQLMGQKKPEVPHSAPLEKFMRRLENSYARALGFFLAKKWVRRGAYLGLIAVFVALMATVLPKLPREIIGRPDTDWLTLGVNTEGNTLIAQMESVAEETEAQVMAQWGAKIHYTFTQIFKPNRAMIMIRLKDKKQMDSLWKEVEERFSNTPFRKYWTGPWNPSELPIPDPPNFKLTVRGGSLEERANLARDIRDQLEKEKIYSRVWSDPELNRSESILIKPYLAQWSAIQKQGIDLQPSDLADISRVASTGRVLGWLMVNNRNTQIQLRYPEGTASTAEDVATFPIGLGSKLVPLKALAEVKVSVMPPPIYRENERDVFMVYGKKKQSEKIDFAVQKTKAENLVKDWALKHPDIKARMLIEDADQDLTQALKQLGVAIGLSILLILATLVIQFGSISNSVLVMVAIPLGMMGVVTALWVFKAPLSLNSVLGVILLNGIAVANSIILVDFTKRLFEGGMAPALAAVEAGRKRLRPILITSLTTVLGMLPIALGWGDGGKILQPLGIAVSGGLWVSMGLTLFVVPALQVWSLEQRKINREELPVDSQSPLQPPPFNPGLRLRAQDKNAANAIKRPQI